MTELLEPGESGREGWHDLPPGTLLAGRYRIERPVSRGGMGAVFRATQLGLDRAVAIKVLLPTYSRDAGMQERFRREARSAASLSHPHIIQIYDYGISDYGPYIVMEFVRGESLRRILGRGPLALDRAVRLIEQVCSAVASAHRAGIIHRDLKPDNIMIEEEPGGPPTAKVLDFGIAKLRAAEVDELSPTLTGARVIGSPSYMSPEQALGLELDGRSDIYALGVVLYEMLAGRPPFADASSVAVILQHVNAAPRRLCEARAEVSEAVESVVMKALAKDRGQRYAAATELAQALRLACDNPHAFETLVTGALPAGPPKPEDAYATRAVAGPYPVTGARATFGGGRRRLAILPLRNLAGDEAIDFLGFALADTVITQLSGLKSLIVRPSSAIEPYRHQVIDPRAVGRELQVDTILSGSYLRAGDLFRVNVQLVDVAANEVLWQERIDLKFDNVITLQDHICDEIIRGLRLNLTTGEQEALKRDEPRHPVAYEHYLRGLAAGQTAEGYRQALADLELAVGLDPAYAPAWAALAGRYLDARHYLRDDSLLAKAGEAVHRALEISPRLPAALFYLAIFHAERGELKEGLAVCKQLLKVAPNSEYAYQAMGHAYDYAGLPDIALTLFRKAREINPVAYPYMIGFIHYQKGDLTAARGEFEARLDACPEMAYWLAVIEFVEGRAEEAGRLIERVIEQQGETKIHGMSSALRCAFRGEREEGLRMLAEIADSGAQLAGYSCYIIAQIYAQLGDLPSCFEMLRAAIRTGYGNYPFLISDPLLAPARADAGFAGVAAEMRQLQTRLQLMLVAG